MSDSALTLVSQMVMSMGNEDMAFEIVKIPVSKAALTLVA